MRESTTIRVSPVNRDALRSLAEHDGVTHDEELSRLLRAERQRRMGASLAAELSVEDQAWIDVGLKTIGENASG